MASEVSGREPSEGSGGRSRVSANASVDSGSSVFHSGIIGQRSSVATEAKTAAVKVCGRIYLLAPLDGSAHRRAPTFAWVADCQNEFVIESSLDLGFSSILKTTRAISNTQVKPRGALWKRIPIGQPIYWRVRSADGTSVGHEVWSVTRY